VQTTRVRVGCLVFSIAFRNPGLLAKSVTAIDHISNGRAECGIGAGWNEPEYRAYGYRFPDVKTREDQLEEYAAALRLLFDEPFADFSGTHYTLRHAPNNPRPVQRRHIAVRSGPYDWDALAAFAEEVIPGAR